MRVRIIPGRGMRGGMMKRMKAMKAKYKAMSPRKKKAMVKRAKKAMKKFIPAFRKMMKGAAARMKHRMKKGDTAQAGYGGAKGAGGPIVKIVRIIPTARGQKARPVTKAVKVSAHMAKKAKASSQKAYRKIAKALKIPNAKSKLTKALKATNVKKDSKAEKATNSKSAKYTKSKKGPLSLSKALGLGDEQDESLPRERKPISLSKALDGSMAAKVSTDSPPRPPAVEPAQWEWF
jgi:hypothetical protein